MDAKLRSAALPEYELRVRIYLEDTDAQGFVYNASYIRFMERARTECLRAAGVDHDEILREHGVQMVLSHIATDFLAPSRLSDMLSVTAKVTDIRGARMTFEQPVHRDNRDGEIVCRGVAQVACMDAKSNRPRRFPRTLFDGLK